MLRHIKPGMLVFSVLYILLGLLLLLAPQAVADVFCIALGLLVVLCGLQSLYGYFKKDNGSIRAAVSLLLSLPTIALGMWALLCTVQSAMTFDASGYKGSLSGSARRRNALPSAADYLLSPIRCGRRRQQ